MNYMKQWCMVILRFTASESSSKQINHLSKGPNHKCWEWILKRPYDQCSRNHTKKKTRERQPINLLSIQCHLILFCCWTQNYKLSLGILGRHWLLDSTWKYTSIFFDIEVQIIKDNKTCKNGYKFKPNIS